MGNKPGKNAPKSSSSSKKNNSVEEHSSNENATEKPVESTYVNNSSPSSATHNDKGASDGEEIHPSWNDAVLFSSTEKKVTKDDFELLTVIGKGSFGKVWEILFYIEHYTHGKSRELFCVNIFNILSSWLEH